MPEAVVKHNIYDEQQLQKLIERQDHLESELKRLKDQLAHMEQENKYTIEMIHKRINTLEKEIADLRTTINEIKQGMETIQKTVISVEKNVSEINVKQDVAIQAQDKFIKNLWKLVFILMGVIVTAATVYFNMFK